MEVLELTEVLNKDIFDLPEYSSTNSQCVLNSPQIISMDVEDDNECIICYKNPTELTISPCCKKTFCRVCLNKCLFLKNIPHCPHCQQRFYIKNFFHFETHFAQYTYNDVLFPRTAKYLFCPLIWLEFRWKNRKRSNQIPYDPQF